MKKTIAALLLAALLFALLPAALLTAESRNEINAIYPAPVGYNFAVQTDPEKIPYLMVQPYRPINLRNSQFTLRLRSAVWDLASYGRLGIDGGYGTINEDGEFEPILDSAGFLTGYRSPAGGPYRLEVVDETTAIVHVDANDIDEDRVLYIPLLVEITGKDAYVTLEDPQGNNLTTEETVFFIRESSSMATTGVFVGETVEFAQSVVLEDIKINEFLGGAISSGALTLTLPRGFRWIGLEDIQVTGSGSGSFRMNGANYAVVNAAGGVDQSILKIELAAQGGDRPRSLILGNLQVEAIEGSNLGYVHVQLAGCNIEPETVRVANKIPMYYTLTAAAGALPQVPAGYDPQDALDPNLRTLTVTFAEVTAGRWRPAGSTTTFSLPQGITARAVRVTADNLAAELPADLVIRRIDENAYAFQSADGGVWTLAKDGLTLRNIKVKEGLAARVTLTFYVTAAASYEGSIRLTGTGGALLHDVSAVIGEGVKKAPVSGAKVKVTIGSKTMQVDGEPVEMDAAPFIEDSHTMVPVSHVARALGLSREAVRWDGAARTVTITTGSRTAVLTIDSKVLLIDGTAVEIAAAPVIRSDRTFLPFRVLGEQVLGVKVSWDGKDTAAFG
jgi:hypothetical protein